MSEGLNSNTKTSAQPSGGASLKTALFALGMAAVLGTAAYLGSQGGAPPMPSRHPELGPAHQLRVNLKGELIGVESEPPVDPTVASQPGFALDKKAAEKRVNEGCKACHDTLPPHHPPKTECIKCHRMAPAGAPSAAPSAAPAAP